ncbi:MAG TPA: hypothetical protein ENH33_00385, partial [Actinobacteria bacterium]|nr:hypothetical protein [Actinomycetota bacterium]
MDTSRLWRVIRARWLIIVVFAVVGALAAFTGATLRNDAITPVFQAEAPVTVFPDQASIVDPKGQILDSVLQQLDNARSLAIASNAAFLQVHPDAEIRPDANLGRLTFVARSGTAGEAQSLAAEMRANYLQQEPLNLKQQLADQLDAVTAQLEEVRGKLAELDTPTKAEIRADSERSRLSGLLSSLRTRQNSLEQELLFATSTTLPPDTEPFRTTEDIQAELYAVRGYISTYQEQLAALPPANDQYSERETLTRA